VGTAVGGTQRPLLAGLDGAVLIEKGHGDRHHEGGATLWTLSTAAMSLLCRLAFHACTWPLVETP
jgi:hypothetical protein